ncbi:zinc-finger domain of monoamine-oxidase A repressor R1-domain-containing protein [Haematococcus lacustris]
MALPCTSLAAFERERNERVAANKKRLMELQLPAVAAAVTALDPKASESSEQTQPRRSRVKVDACLEPSRRSGRERPVVCYKEEIAKPRCEAQPAVCTLRVLSAEEVEELRASAGIRVTVQPDSADGLSLESESQVYEASKRQAMDSGKGVRVQGGRVYDSKHGVTCHWCRQKTLEEHVTCSNPGCGKGRRLPTSFCKMCLKNRHGEDCVAAAASGSWQCPGCRGSCGAGCVCCCNCGPCRKKLSLEPTHQVVRLAKEAGFTNVHDYLVHIVTGESSEQIAGRKVLAPWGSWMKVQGQVPGRAGLDNKASMGCKSRNRPESLTTAAPAEADMLGKTATPASPGCNKHIQPESIVSVPARFAEKPSSATEQEQLPSVKLTRKQRMQLQMGLTSMDDILAVSGACSHA